MNEEQKHIESCRSEDPLAQTMEACGNESDIQAALQPLLRETMQGYEPVATTAPISPIAELPGVLISIIRRVATKPLAILGDRPAKQSLLGSLVTTWNAIRQRLAGNPSLGIPDRRADMSGHSLPTALALLSDRKITNGFSTTDGIPDGMSLARLLGDSSVQVTKLIDNNDSWGALRENFNLLSIFPNLAYIQLNCKTLNCYSYRALQNAAGIIEFAMPYLETIYGYPFTNSFTADTELDFPSLNYVTFGSNFSPCIQGCNMKKFTADNLEILRSTGTNSPTFYNCPNLEEIHMRSLRYCNHWGVTTEGGGLAYQCANLRKVVVGDLSYGPISGTSGTSANGMGFSGCPKLVYIEVGANGEPVSVDMDMRWWNPTYSLQNELQQFLTNFREFIAERLAKYTGAASGKPLLTLSQAVRNAIEADGIASFIKNDRNWEISPEPNNQ